MAVSVSDNFNVSSNVDLDAHTPSGESGPWRERISATSRVARIQAADDWVEASGNDNSDGMLYTFPTDPGEKDQDIECTLDTVAGGAGDPIILIGRYIDANNFYYLVVYRAGDNPDIRVGEMSAGTASDATANIGPANGDKVKLEIRGTTIKAYIDTGSGYTEQASHSAGTDHANGEWGLAWGNCVIATDDISGSWRIDDWQAESFASGGAQQGDTNVDADARSAAQGKGIHRGQMVATAEARANVEGRAIHRGHATAEGVANALAEGSTAGGQAQQGDAAATGEAQANVQGQGVHRGQAIAQGEAVANSQGRLITRGQAAAEAVATAAAEGRSPGPQQGEATAAAEAVAAAQGKLGSDALWVAREAATEGSWTARSAVTESSVELPATFPIVWGWQQSTKAADATPGEWTRVADAA